EPGINSYPVPVRETITELRANQPTEQHRTKGGIFARPLRNLRYVISLRGECVHNENIGSHTTVHLYGKFSIHQHITKLGGYTYVLKVAVYRIRTGCNSVV